jgi:hypothetical protein
MISGMSQPHPLILLAHYRVELSLQVVSHRRDRVLAVEERDGSLELVTVITQLIRGHRVREADASGGLQSCARSSLRAGPNGHVGAGIDMASIPRGA